MASWFEKNNVDLVDQERLNQVKKLKQKYYDVIFKLFVLFALFEVPITVIKYCGYGDYICVWVCIYVNAILFVYWIKWTLQKKIMSVIAIILMITLICIEIVYFININ